MDNNKQQISIFKIAKTFEKIYKGLNKKQVAEVEKEMAKIVSSESSEVFMAADYEDEENSMGMSIYISNPLTEQDTKKIHFDKLMFEYLLRADISKLPDIMECIDLMECKGTDNYSIDAMPVFYTKELGDYDIQFRITKELT